MSKISDLAAEAFFAMHYFKSGNTEVRVVKDSENISSVEMLLHGNRIAYMDKHMRAQIDFETLAKWPTNITINRLRALGFDVGRRNGKTLADGVEIQT